MPSRSSQVLRALAFALPALAAGACSEGRTQEIAPPGSLPIVTVSRPLARAIVDWDDFIGRFAAVEQVEIRPRVSGYLNRVTFRDGDIVRRGQLLYQIDPRPFRATLAQAQAEEARARTALALARTELARAGSLLAAEAISREEYEARRAAVASAQANVGAARANVRARALDVEFAEVRAPITGRISDSRVDRGNLVTGGGQGEATLLTTIVSVDPIHFEFEGSEALYLKYQRQDRQGSRVSSRFTANPVEIRLQDEASYSIRGRMSFVDNALDPRSGTIRGRAVVANPNGFLTPGMFGRLRLLGSGAYSALLVPDSAIVTDHARRLVMVLGPSGIVAPRVVEVGPMVDGLRIVRGGLNAEDRVIIAGLQRVRAGEKAAARRGRILPTAPGQSPSPDAAYAPPPAGSATPVG